MAEPDESDASELVPAELTSWLRERRAFTVLDVRDRDAFETWHVSGPSVEAVQRPHQKFIAARVTETTAELAPAGPEPVLVVCAVGEASAEVAEQLRGAGVDAWNLAGGMAAWARHYEAVELLCSTATVLQYHRPSTGCLSYLVVDEGNERRAAVIDPLRAFAERYAADAAAHDASLAYAVDTHVHADHVSGVRTVAAQTGAEPVYPRGISSHEPSFEATPTLVQDGESLALGHGTIALETVGLPGHTPDGVGFRLGDSEQGDLLFCGDTLFLTTVARPDLAVESEAVDVMARTLYASLATLASMAPETRVAPGHVSESTRPDDGGRYVATLGDLRERLDLLGLDEAAFVERVTGSLPPRPANDAEIRRINLGQQAADDETAFELELGPNNCAVE
ncbi:MBL fold metallo-hydrolase [Halolamina sp.]|uniref:MBL fold metallo-hydrolase n=1 Tax=Halolamina sp. TaxID=1940283 RepID=UPI00356A6559